MAKGKDEDLFHDHIPLMRPWLGETEIEEVAKVIRSGWIAQGPKVAEFEQAVARYLGVPHAVATNSATSATHLCLRLSDIGPEDRVVVPSHTCMATLNSIHLCGAQPLFGDIDPLTFNLSVESAEAAVKQGATAILVVDQIGMPCDLDSFSSLATTHGLTLIQDAATAFGASYKGRRLGSLGPLTIFSFHPRKMITTGEGGMLTTHDAKLAEKARALRSAGASISDLERHKAKGMLLQKYYDFGHNYRMTDMQGALGLVQMTKAQEILDQRTALARVYDEALTELEGVDPPFVPDYATPAYSSYLLSLRGPLDGKRDQLLSYLSERGVSCRTAIQPAHLEPYYQGAYKDLELPHTAWAAANTMFLPIFPGMTAEQQTTVIRVLKEGVASVKRLG